MDRIIKKIIRFFDYKKRNVKIWYPSNIYLTAKLGDNVSVGRFSEIGHNVEIGNNTRIGMGVFIPEGVKIGNNCFIGPRVCFSNDRYPPSHKWQWQKTIIEDGVALGANVCIRPGIIIKKGSMIGMGSVVTWDIPEDEIWVGNPARHIRSVHDVVEHEVPKYDEIVENKTK